MNRIYEREPERRRYPERWRDAERYDFDPDRSRGTVPEDRPYRADESYGGYDEEMLSDYDRGERYGTERWDENPYGAGESAERSRYGDPRGFRSRESGQSGGSRSSFDRENMSGRYTGGYGDGSIERGTYGGDYSSANFSNPNRIRSSAGPNPSRSVWSQGAYGRQDRYGSYGSRFGRSNWGQFTGKGPKGYRRSDERISEDVNEALAEHPELDASEIEVKVQNGEVILSGTVSERRFKRMAEEAVEGYSGVQDVRNEIRVRSAGGNSEESVTSQPARWRTGSSARAQNT